MTLYMQEYSCIICDYSTTRALNLDRHNKSSRHQKNMKKLCSQNNNLSIDNKNNKIMSTALSTGVSTNDDKYICKYCGDKFTYRQSHNKHVRERCKKNKESVEYDSIKKTNTESIMLSVVKNMADKIDELGEKLERQSKQIKNIMSSETTGDIVKIAKNTSETANKSLSMLKYATKNFKSAPALKQIKKAEATKMITYEPDNKKYIDLEEFIVSKYRKGILVDFIGDIIIDYYQKDNPKMQSFWKTDISRLTFIIKKHSTDGKSTWINDSKGVSIMKMIIQPLYDEVRNIMQSYTRKVYDILNNSNIKITNEEYKDLTNESQTAVEIIGSLQYKKIQKSTLIYIAPHFGFDLSKSDILNTFESPESESDEETTEVKSIDKIPIKRSIRELLKSNEENKSKKNIIKKSKYSCVKSESESEFESESSDSC
jgi:hypothetical protein